jgi:aconitate hydratase
MFSSNYLDTFDVGKKRYTFVSVPKFSAYHDVEIDTIPFTIKLFVEYLIRTEQSEAALRLLEQYRSEAQSDIEFTFSPSRLIMQDYTGVPVLVDLASLRTLLSEKGQDPRVITPQLPTTLVIDHSIQAEHFGCHDASQRNYSEEIAKNTERYQFIRWAQDAFDNIEVVPPNRGIVHQINVENKSVLLTEDVKDDGKTIIYPDSVIGSDSHTTMINGIGVLGWGAGGLEVESLMLGIPTSRQMPALIGVQIEGELGTGVSAYDLALYMTNLFRRENLSGSLVEIYGSGVKQLSAFDRCTIANMAPEMGIMCCLFPVDQQTIQHLSLTGKTKHSQELATSYYSHQKMMGAECLDDSAFSHVVKIDLSHVSVSIAGPYLPNNLTSVEQIAHENPISHHSQGKKTILDGHIAIASITSCTTTSNPELMLTAALLAKNAAAKGLKVQPDIKTTFAPGSRSVLHYLTKGQLMEGLEALGFYHVGYGCTTCNGGSGTLTDNVIEAIEQGTDCVAVVSSNRNYTGRIHGKIEKAYLCSPAMTVAYALAGNIGVDVLTESLGKDLNNNDVYLKDIMPTRHQVEALYSSLVTKESFETLLNDNDKEWLSNPKGNEALHHWDIHSTYLQNPSFLTEVSKMGSSPYQNMNVLLNLGDDISTDDISPVAKITTESYAGQYLLEKGESPLSLNSYGARRSNHHVMIRGGFSGPRKINLLGIDLPSGHTLHSQTNEIAPVHQVALDYLSQGQCSVIFAGERYGVGSSRDWAAKVQRCLGVKVVIAASFERIHRANLVAVGILPLILANEDAQYKKLLNGREKITVRIPNQEITSDTVSVEIENLSGSRERLILSCKVALYSRSEREQFRSGGLLPYALETLAGVSECETEMT